MIDHINKQKIENAKYGFEHLKEQVLNESKECNPRIVVTAEGFGHQTQILNVLLTDKKDREFYFHENARTNAQAHRNLKNCGCMKK